MSLSAVSTAGVPQRILASATLRVGLFPSFFYSRAKGGELVGWGIEMARALAAQLGLEPEFLERASPPAVVSALRAGECDIAFIGITPERKSEVDFSAPWVRGEFTFLVPAGSAVARIGDADKPGIRVGVVRNHAMDAALKGKLAAATTIYADTPDAAFALLESGEVDALAGIRPGLNAYAARAPGSRVLADSYGANVIGLAVAKGEPQWHALICRFVEGSKSDGSARAAAERVGARGLDIVA